MVPSTLSLRVDLESLASELKQVVRSHTQLISWLGRLLGACAILCQRGHHQNCLPKVSDSRRVFCGDRCRGRHRRRDCNCCHRQNLSQNGLASS